MAVQGKVRTFDSQLVIRLIKANLITFKVEAFQILKKTQSITTMADPVDNKSRHNIRYEQGESSPPCWRVIHN